MNAILKRPVLDHHRGAWHEAGERVEVCARIRRADFDAREMTKVRFANGSEALLFEDEIGCEVTVDDSPGYSKS